MVEYKFYGGFYEAIVKIRDRTRIRYPITLIERFLRIILKIKEFGGALSS